MARLVPTMLPTITPRPSRRASAAMARPSVRPPHLSSLMLTTSKRPTSPGTSASVSTLSSAAIGTGDLKPSRSASRPRGERLLEQRHALLDHRLDQPFEA